MSSTVSRWRRSSAHGGGAVPVRLGRGEGAQELREVTAELARRSARAEELRRRGSTARVSSPEFTRGGGSVLRVWGRERARGRVDCDAGSPGVLRRAQDGSQGCCSARATAAARWQPRGGSGRRGDGRGHQREGVVGPGFKG